MILSSIKTTKCMGFNSENMDKHQNKIQIAFGIG